MSKEIRFGDYGIKHDGACWNLIEHFTTTPRKGEGKRAERVIGFYSRADHIAEKLVDAITVRGAAHTLGEIHDAHDLHLTISASIQELSEQIAKVMKV